MLRYHIGRYTYYHYIDKPNSYYHMLPVEFFGVNRQPDEDDIIKSYDQLLHQSLDKILNKRHYSSNNKNLFLRGLRRINAYRQSILRPILEQEPILNKYFSKEEFGKLSLLWISILAGYDKSAELLVRFGADVNELFGRHDPPVIDETWTILYVMLQMYPTPENERLVRLVTDHGADLHVRDHNGQTVLQPALRRGHSLIEMLIEKGAEVNTTDNDGNTPLLEAASSKKGNVLVPLMMKHGADVFARNRFGSNVLHRLGCWETQNFQEHNNNTAELARVLIEMGVSVNDKEHPDCHWQPIHHAARHQRNNELVNVFLDYGANVNALTKDGEFPLYYAATYKNDHATMKSLLKRGANVNLRTIRDRTALHAACIRAAQSDKPTDCEMMEVSIELLLSAGADVLAEDSNGNRPLACILSGGNAEPPGIWLLIKALALKKALQPSIELKDEMIIERHHKLQDYYRKCIDEINSMKSMRFIDTCTFVELLAKSYIQVAALMQNIEFETKFKKFDLNKFPIYCKNILQAYERAQEHYSVMSVQENVINEAVYNILPYLVVKKIAHYINII